MQIFARLQSKVDPTSIEAREKDMAARVQAQQVKSQARSEELVSKPHISLGLLVLTLLVLRSASMRPSR